MADLFGIGTAFGTIAGSAINAASQASTNQINKNIAEQNLAYQKEVQEYQKALQQTIFDREDTAYQRAATDLRNAGLNRQLATGASARAGEAINVTAPQMNFRHQSVNMGDALINGMQMLNQNRITEAQVELMNAQADQAHANADFTRGSKTDELNSRIPLNNAKVAYTNAMSERIGYLNDLTQDQRYEIASRIKHLKVSNAEINKRIEQINTEINYMDLKVEGQKISNFEELFELMIRGYDFNKYFQAGLPTNAQYEAKTFQQAILRAGNQVKTAYDEMAAEFNRTYGVRDGRLNWEDFVNSFVANPTNLMNLIKLFGQKN